MRSHERSYRNLEQVKDTQDVGILAAKLIPGMNRN
jgi:hypothetical protein